MEKTFNKKITYCIFTFMLYAFIGWIYEVILEFYYGNGFVNRGFLFGPYLPVYGFGVLIILLLIYKFSKCKFKIGRISITPFLVFILIFFITTIVEYITGTILDFCIGTRLWDYSNYSFNINGLVCVSASTRFAIGGTIFIYALQPKFDRLINVMNGKVRNGLAYSMLLLVIIDFISTIIQL